jgi:hypothetical protein
MEQVAFEVVQVHKITDTDRQGYYVLDITLSINGETERVENYLSAPDDPHGANPVIRVWMNQNPDFPVHPYVPPEAADPREAMPLLTARQFRLGLVNAGLTPSQVTAAIEAMPAGTAKEKAKIEWEYATTFKRTHPLIGTIAAAMGLAPDNVDSMWMASVNL